jgi:hypothetical protein
MTNWKVIIVAIGCMTLLEGFALHKGIDGTLFSLVIAAIAGLAGYTLKTNDDVK